MLTMPKGIELQLDCLEQSGAGCTVPVPSARAQPRKPGHALQLYPLMKPHVRRGRVAKEKRIERARARASAPRKQAA